VLIPRLLYKDISHLALLVYRPPQIVALSTNRDKHLIEMPGVAKPAPSMSQPVCQGLAALQTPQAYGLIAHGDSTFSQQLLDIPKAEAKAMIEPHSVRNKLGRKSVATIVGISDAHAGSICRIPY
jgi:hypothetical protein